MLSKRFPAVCLLLIVSFGCPAVTHAGLFEQLAVCPAASSMGNAVTAYADACGGLAVHYNPALLATFEGTRLDVSLFFTVNKREVKFTQGIDPETGELWAPFGGWFNDGIDPLGGTEGELQSGYMVIPLIDHEIPYLLAPSLGIAYKPPEPDTRLTFGFGQYAPFGVGFKNHSGDPLSFLGRKAFFLRMVLAAPALAYQLTDTVSVGASIGLGVTLFSFETNLRTPNTMVALTGALGDSTAGLEIPILSELTLPPPWFGGGLAPYEKMGELELMVEDYFTTSYNLGFLWEPTPWFSFGACYQSESETTMEGDYEMSYGQRFQNTVDWLGRSPLTVIVAAMFDLPYEAAPYQDGTATVSMTWPARLQLGVKIQPLKQVTFTCDAHWTDWEAWDALEIELDQKIQLLRFARMLGYTGGPDVMSFQLGYENTWHFSYGLEIRPIKSLAIRLGYEPRPTSVQDDLFGPVPMSDMNLYSLGVGITLDDKPKPKAEGFFGTLKQLLHPNAIDLNVTLLDMEDHTVEFNESTNLNSIDFTDIVYNPYAGLIVEQEYSVWLISLNQVFRW